MYCVVCRTDQSPVIANLSGPINLNPNRSHTRTTTPNRKEKSDARDERRGLIWSDLL
jgi:hypothetical protein